MSLAELGDVSDRWQRYAYRGARVLLDRLDGRVAELVHAQATLTPERPYNKYLCWELATYPLPAPWTADHLLAALADRPSRLFAELEVVVRARGFGDVLDAWDELDLIR